MTRAMCALVALALHLGLPPGASGQPPLAAPAERAAAQQRLRERFARMLRDRVGLSDDQLRRLAPVSRGFDARRQALFRDERTARQALRRELSAASPDQARVGAQIDQLLGIQRRRLDLIAEEQRELATFMTPVQRARYLALQDLLRRRADEMRRRRGNGPARGGGRRAPPGTGPRF